MSQGGVSHRVKEHPAPPNQGGLGHIHALDGVRGLALLMIFVDHLLATNDAAANPLAQVALQLRDLTWTGVYLFFSLSGFLITGILVDTLDCDNYFRTFFGRRILRIFPLYYGVLILLALLTGPCHLQWHGQQWMLWTYLGNRPFAPQFEVSPASWLNLRHFWSLAVEEQFYLLWPLAVFWCRTWRKIAVAAAVGMAFSIGLRWYLALYGHDLFSHSLLCSADSLLPGSLLALLFRSRYRDHVRRFGIPVFLASAGIVMFLYMRPPFFHPSARWNNDQNSNHLFAVLGLPLCAIGYAALIAAALRPGTWLARTFGHPFLRFFGRYSYGLYVVHFSVHAALTMRCRTWLLAHGSGVALSVLLPALLVAGISVVLAYLSYNYYEVHFLRLKRFFPYRKRSPASTAA